MTRKLFLLCSLILATIALPALAEETQSREERRAQWESMSDEQRDAKRAEMRERWNSMSDEQRAEKKAQMRKRYENASPEERAQMQERMQNRRGHGGHEGQRGGDGTGKGQRPSASS